MATPAASGSGTAKAVVAEQISQAVQSTSNLLHLMQQSSPAQAQLIKLPKSLLAKTSTIKNTEQVLEQMPRVISSLDAYMENGLQKSTFGPDPRLQKQEIVAFGFVDPRLASPDLKPNTHYENVLDIKLG